MYPLLMGRLMCANVVTKHSVCTSISLVHLLYIIYIVSVYYTSLKRKLEPKDNIGAHVKSVM